MNKFKDVEDIIKDEIIKTVIRKKSARTGWQPFRRLGVDYGEDAFILTSNRIIYIIKDNIIKNIEYDCFENISFNPINDSINCKNRSNENISFKLTELRLHYDEIQLLKHQLNT
jgi:hypothetical protein